MLEFVVANFHIGDWRECGDSVGLETYAHFKPAEFGDPALPHRAAT